MSPNIPFEDADDNQMQFENSMVDANADRFSHGRGTPDPERASNGPIMMI